VHATVSVDESEISGFEGCASPDLADLAVWIDPIDATSQYIKGGEGSGLEGGLLPTKGLGVVTVLIGAFQPSSGRPLLGVVNQPFRPAGPRLHWAALAAGDRWRHSSSLAQCTAARTRPRLLVGSSESPELLARWLPALLSTLTHLAGWSRITTW
jgi:hypothetical protein